MCQHAPKAVTREGIARSEGFTLIELLVVISIIAMLIALLLPALGLARTVANNAIGTSNHRQILVATHAFQSDFGHLPAPHRASALSGQGPNDSSFWMSFSTDFYVADDAQRFFGDELLDAGYLSSGEAFSDPGLDQHLSAPSGVWDIVPWNQHPDLDDLRDWGFQTNYGVNMFMLNSSLNRGKLGNYPAGVKGLWEPATSFNKLHFDAFESPSENAWMMDLAWADAPNRAGGPRWDMADRQGQKIFGFADGHAALIPFEAHTEDANVFWNGGAFSDWDASYSDTFLDRLWNVRHRDPAGGNWNNGWDLSHF